MGKFRNKKPYLTGSDEDLTAHHLSAVDPWEVANALLRQAAQNARSSGTDMMLVLLDEIKLPLWMVDLAKEMDYTTLELWQMYLSDPMYPLTNERGVTLAQVDCLLRIKRFVTEELMMPPTVNETKVLQYKSTVETAVARQANRPKKTRSKNFTPEKGSHEAPDYDGGEFGLFKDDVQRDLWVFPTEIVQWPTKKTIFKVSELKKIYWDKVRSGADDPGIPIHHLKYDVKDWVLHNKPSLEETYARPDKARRNEIQFYKRRELDTLRLAVRQMEEGKASMFWKLAFKYLGKYASVDLDDISREKRIENEIRRKYNNKMYRVEGKTYLPPIAAGEMLHPMIDERVKLLVSKNPKLRDDLPWVIKAYFDAEARENPDGTSVVMAGVGRRMAKHNDEKSKSK